MEVGGHKKSCCCFSLEKAVVVKDEIPTEKLYARIGQLTLENDFLKKSLG
jgi:transposase